MTQLVPLAQQPPPAQAAVAVSKGGIGLHAGIVYRAADDKVHVLHLAWHHLLKDDVRLAASSWAAATPTIDAIDLEVLAGYCATVGQQGMRVPYALGFDQAHLDDDLQLQLGTDRGLTCATFVLMMFARAGIPLLARETWQTRPEDVAAQQALVAFLERTAGVDPAHVAAVRQQVGCMRYRTEEVAAASAESVRPVAFTTAEPRGVALKQAYATLFS